MGWSENDRHDRADPSGIRGGRAELEAVMSRLAAGDEAAVVTLYERFGGQIAGAVRAVARRRPARIERGDLDGLVYEVCEELRVVASAWSPAGGALPWVWARHRVANVVDRVLGQITEPIDEVRLAQLDHDRPVDATSAADGTMLDALERLAPDLASARLLIEALDEVAISRRDRELVLQYAYEKHSGNASPAATVAPAFGMREPSVRQAARRARERLLRLAASDARYAPLADLPLLA